MSDDMTQGYQWRGYVGPEPVIAAFKAALEAELAAVPPTVADMLPASGQPARESGIGSDGTPLYSFSVCVPQERSIERPAFIAEMLPEFAQALVPTLRVGG